MQSSQIETLSSIATYRGGQGMWAWILHRVTGVGVLLFLVIHVLDTWLIGFGPAIYDKVMALYRAPLFRMGEVFLAASLLFHALNGVRIAIIDFWPATTPHYRKMFGWQVAVFVLIFIPTAYWMLKPVFF